jgi:hypothetical protein
MLQPSVGYTLTIQVSHVLGRFSSSISFKRLVVEEESEDHAHGSAHNEVALSQGETGGHERGFRRTTLDSNL